MRYFEAENNLFTINSNAYTLYTITFCHFSSLLHRLHEQIYLMRFYTYI